MTKPIVAHTLIPYIRETETFIYERIINHDRYAPLVLTDEPVINTDKFPFNNIVTLAQKSFLDRKMDVLYKKTIGTSPFLLRELKNRGVSVVHAHYGPVGAAVATSCEKASVPLMVSFYGIDASSFLKIDDHINKYTKLFKIAKIISVLSVDMKNRICEAGCPEDKVRIHHLAVNTEILTPDHLPNNEEHIKIVATGRLVPKKAMDKLVEAFSRIASKFPLATLHIYGDGPMKKDVEIKISERNLSDRVTMYGHRDRSEVLSAIKSSDIFALFSITADDGDMEGTPTVLIEAGALGIPSVSTYHAGIPEVVLNNETGLLSEENNVEEFANNLSTLAADTSMRKKLGAAARNHITANYDIKSIVRKIEADYDKIIS